jgi:hypothetical protein
MLDSLTCQVKVYFLEFWAVDGEQLTSNMKPTGISRLMPCPAALKAIIDLVNEAPTDSVLLDLAVVLPRLEDDYLQFMTITAGIEDFEDEIYRDLRASARNMKSWIDKLVEVHRAIASALRVFPERSRVRLWEEALMPNHSRDGNYGPDGKLSDEGVERQTELARVFAPSLATDPLEQSFDRSSLFLSEFAGRDRNNARLCFWAFYGLHKKYQRLREYRTNLHKVMRIAELNPTDRLTSSEILDPIVITQEYSVDERGKFIQWGNPFTDALEDDDVEVTRIRSCDNCKRVFWAGRRDQMCCTPACNHARHSKRTRKKHRHGLLPRT